jgi:hypothetical protein
MSDIGVGAGAYANPRERERFEWVQERVVDGHRVFVGLHKPERDGRKYLCVTFMGNGMNFSGAVQSQREIDEMLGIVLTYQPISGQGWRVVRDAEKERVCRYFAVRFGP